MNTQRSMWPFSRQSQGTTTQLEPAGAAGTTIAGNRKSRKVPTSSPPCREVPPTPQTTAPRIALPHMLPSTFPASLGLCDLPFRWLKPTPRRIITHLSIRMTACCGIAEVPPASCAQPPHFVIRPSVAQSSASPTHRHQISRGQKRANRDRGASRETAPPTPPDIRVRIRRFDRLCRLRGRDGGQADRLEEGV